VTPIIERGDVGEEIVQPVSVRRVLSRVPIFRQREFAVETTFSFRLVINRIEADDTLKEDVELRVR
jgi:hypothetical protein